METRKPKVKTNLTTKNINSFLHRSLELNMPQLTKSLHDWNTDHFSSTLKNELEELPAGTLPLEKGVAQGGMVDDSHISATILSSDESETEIHAKAGIFFTEIVINCGCGDDPMPTNAYCEMQLMIDKTTAETVFTVI